jgi:hypothetical protein
MGSGSGRDVHVLPSAASSTHSCSSVYLFSFTVWPLALPSASLDSASIWLHDLRCADAENGRSLCAWKHCFRGLAATTCFDGRELSSRPARAIDNLAAIFSCGLRIYQSRKRVWSSDDVDGDAEKGCSAQRASSDLHRAFRRARSSRKRHHRKSCAQAKMLYELITVVSPANTNASVAIPHSSNHLLSMDGI